MFQSKNNSSWYFHKFTHLFIENSSYPSQILTNLIFVDKLKKNTLTSVLHAMAAQVSMWTDGQVRVSL